MRSRVPATLAPGSPPTQTMRTRASRRSRPMDWAVSAIWAMKDGVPMTQSVPYSKMVSTWRCVSPDEAGITSAPTRCAASVAPRPPTNQA